MQFSYVNPTMIHFGQGQIASIRRDIPKDHKVLVLYGGVPLNVMAFMTKWLRH